MIYRARACVRVCVCVCVMFIFTFITGVIMASLLAVQPAMMQDRNCFELYGYDILLSDDLRPWLLEINASPALTGTDNEDQRLKSDLVDDVLNVLDFEVPGVKLIFHILLFIPCTYICAQARAHS